VLVDFMFLIAIFINLEYPWVRAENSLWLYNVFYYIEIQKPLAERGGFQVYTAIFYILTAMLIVCVLVSL
jgi:hypothetical protein